MNAFRGRKEGARFSPAKRLLSSHLLIAGA
jgi:hypothetical protein